MRGTMEAVSSDFILFVQFIRQRIQIGHLIHRLMEGRVKHRYLRYARHCPFTRLYSDQVRRIMKRRQLAALVDRFFHIFVNEHRFAKKLTAVYHPVSYSFDFIHAVDHAVLFVYQCVDNHLDRVGVVLHRFFDDNLLLTGRLKFITGTFDSDSFT